MDIFGRTARWDFSAAGLRGAFFLLPILLVGLAAITNVVFAQKAVAELALSAYADPEDDSVIWVGYSPSALQAYSFWFESQNGILADWQLPEGAELGQSRFPMPMETGVINAPNFVFGAGDQVFQQIKLSGDGPQSMVKIGLRLTYGLCENECVPQTSSAIMELRPDELGVFEADVIETRRRGNWVRVDDGGINMVMHRAYNDDGPISRAFFLPVRPDLFAGPAPLRMIAFEERGFFTLFPAQDGIASDQVFEGILILDKPAENGLEAYRIAPRNDLKMSAGDGASDSPSSSNSTAAEPRDHSEAQVGFLMAAALAFIGGLILNVMPCVFPVLALKVFSVIQSTGQQEASVRKDALAYTLGVVASFMLIAAVLIAIRAAGVGAGWGYQLQSPFFVLSMALVFFVMALNFAGAFELPGMFSGVGQGLTEKGGTQGSFFTGVLATLVAAPCTAPFMVTAVAFALGQPAPTAIAIFGFMGLGLAAPYLLIGFVPASRSMFPKPGAWMQIFRGFLAYPMFAAVVWLVWILSIQTGPQGVLLVSIAMLAIGFIVWVLRTLKGGLRAVSALLSAAMVVYAYSAVPLGTTGAPPRIGDRLVTGDGTQPASVEMAMVPFTEERLQTLRREGKHVFLHHWAAWCIICVLHDNLIYSTPEFRQYLAENDIVFMVADRTKNDPELVAYMEANYGRSNQPIDVFWPRAQASGPVVLPQLFTRERLINIMREEIATSEARR